MKYYAAPEWDSRMRELIRTLGMNHVALDRVVCFKSTGSKARRTIARIHSLPKIIQLGLQTQPFYVIELISEQFDRQSEEEKIKTLLHELMHIPHSFKGGFRKHKPYVNHRTVDAMYKRYAEQNRLGILVGEHP